MCQVSGWLFALAVGVLYSGMVLATPANIPKQKIKNPPAANETLSKPFKSSEKLPLAIQQTRDKALEAQQFAFFAIRNALNASQRSKTLDFQSGTRTKVYSVFTNAQGYRYEGEWLKINQISMVYHGFGQLSWANGNRYEGQFINGHKEGYGVFTSPNGDNYAGEWRNGAINGYGRYLYATGERYEGQYRNDNREGFGVMFYPNGERYEGRWQDNEKSGYGILYSNDGGIKYAGAW